MGIGATGPSATITMGADSTLAGNAGALRTLGIVERLCRGLREAGISYCHWKSNESLDHALAGEGDLDLLVRRRDSARFEELLQRLGFKRARVTGIKDLPAVFNAYGYDEASGGLVHIHAHYQLIVGDDMTKNYRLPIEEGFLTSASLSRGIMIPAPEYEFVVFAVRMMLKHAGWDAILTRHGRLAASERRELDYLTARVDPQRLRAVVQAELPFVGPELLERCARALKPGAAAALRIGTTRRLERALLGQARRSRLLDLSLKLWRRIWTALRRRIHGKAFSRKRLETGGAIVALVGGDGAGKSTAVEALSAWLAKDFDVVGVHMGKPKPSVLGRLAEAVWGMGRPLRHQSATGAVALAAASMEVPLGPRAHVRLIRQLLLARDRWREYARAGRLAARGAIVVCDRYPLAQLRLMDAPAATHLAAHRSRLVRWLAALEGRYYDRIRPPDLLIVLKVDPELAVSRKLGVEQPTHVLPRSEEIWQVDWAATPARIVDSGRSRTEVLAEIKSIVWARL